MKTAGYVLSGIAALFLFVDALGKLLLLQPVVDGSTQLGYPAETIVPMGVLLMIGVVLYVIPRTSVLGAIWLTGYLGGAIATHVRVGNPLPTHTLFPIYVAVFVWGGLALRDVRLRSVLLGAER
jgi:hypothetical protein